MPCYLKGLLLVCVVYFLWAMEECYEEYLISGNYGAHGNVFYRDGRNDRKIYTIFIPTHNNESKLGIVKKRGKSQPILEPLNPSVNPINN